MRPDIIAKIRLLRKEEGGRKERIECRPEWPYFGCPFFFDGGYFDCRLLLGEQRKPLDANTWTVLPIKFLFPDLIKPRLSPGVHFKLWEMGDFAEGEVLEVLSEAEGRGH